MTHPDHDCEDCGVYHTAWSAADRQRRQAEEEREVQGDNARWRFTRLHSLSPEGHPLYIEVEEPDSV